MDPIFLDPGTFYVPALPRLTSCLGHGISRVQRTRTNFSFHFNASSNAAFTVLRVQSLSAGTWNTVQEGITTGTKADYRVAFIP